MDIVALRNLYMANTMYKENIGGVRLENSGFTSKTKDGIKEILKYRLDKMKNIQILKKETLKMNYKIKRLKMKFACFFY